MLASAEIQAGCGLVKNQQLRLVDERAGDQSSALFACRKFAKLVVQAMTQADGMKQLPGMLDLALGRLLIQTHRCEVTGAHGHRRAECRIDDGSGDMGKAIVGGRVDQADAFAEREDVGLADGLVKDGEPALRGEHRPRQAAGEGGLAAAVGAEDRGGLATPDLTGQAIEDGGWPAFDHEVFTINGERICIVHPMNVSRTGREMSKRHEQILKELTSLPTGAGLESRVVQWIESWAKRRKTVTLTRDKFGNMTIKRKGARSSKPVYFTAHLDHPAFAVTEVLDHGRTIQAEFRGGVHDDYFKGTPVALHLKDKPPISGKVVSLDRKRSGDLLQIATIQLDRITAVLPGDLLTWSLPQSKVVKGRLHAPVCDDLAAVAAAICAYEKLLKNTRTMGDVRLLFTLAEEVGFIGAIGAAKAGSVPKKSTLVCLENSKSMVESPIGGGPIIRVGDRISIFDPELTAKLVAVAEATGKEDKRFKYQRKLMPGGACEATAFRAYGYLSSCICLPLGNYHNMDESKKKIAPEIIAVDDFHMLVQLLEAVGRLLPTTRAQQDLVKRLDGLFDRRSDLLD